MFKNKHVYIFIILICLSILRYTQVYDKFQRAKTENFNNDKYLVFNIISNKNSVTKFYARNTLSKSNYLFEVNNNLLSDNLRTFECYHIDGKEEDISSNIKNNNKYEQNYNSNSSYLKFNTEKYYAKDNVYKKVRVKNLSLIDTKQCKLKVDEIIYKNLYQFRDKIISKFLLIYDQPYAGFVAGILVAGKGLMSEETLKIFKRTSLSHVVVLSGSNVSIIIIFIKSILDFFVRSKNIKNISYTKNFILIFFIISFAIITGGDPPIVRATISALIIILFDLKDYLSLAYVALIMFIVNPYDFIYNPSTHLTFLATVSLMLYSERWINEFRKLLLRLKFFINIKFIIFLSNVLGTTFATQILITPYILLMSNSFSPVFLISNILILPSIPFVMLLGFINLLLNIEIIYYINKYLLKYIFFTTTKISELDYSLIVLSKKFILPILSFYILLFLLLNVFHGKK